MNFQIATLGKGLILLGLIIIFVGIIVLFYNKIPYVGRLPGDIMIKRDNFVFYFPLTTCILISVILYIIFRIFR